MKKTILTATALILAVFILSSCGHSRKLGCPAVAQKSTQSNQVRA